MFREGPIGCFALSLSRVSRLDAFIDGVLFLDLRTAGRLLRCSISLHPRRDLLVLGALSGWRPLRPPDLIEVRRAVPDIAVDIAPEGDNSIGGIMDVHHPVKGGTRNFDAVLNRAVWLIKIGDRCDRAVERRAAQLFLGFLKRSMLRQLISQSTQFLFGLFELVLLDDANVVPEQLGIKYQLLSSSSDDGNLLSATANLVLC